MKTPYFIPPRATRDPNTISMCMTSNMDGGSGKGVVLRCNFSIDATSPISIIGSLSLEEIEKVFAEVCCSFDEMSSLF